MVTKCSVLHGAKVISGKRVAIIGYGNQGRPHALNLRESGISVVVGGRRGSVARRNAEEDGFFTLDGAQAAAMAELVIVALPDLVHAEVCPTLICAMEPTAVLGFLHGFSVHYGAVVVPESHGVVLVAPKGPGTALRERFKEGFGIPSLLAVHQGGADPARTEALAIGWAQGIGSDRAGIIRTTFRDETETDLFGEQTVLCGGLSELIRVAFETLVEAGYPPLLAYTECCHEVKQIADLICDRGIAGMGEAISTTARFGALDAGARVIDDSVRIRMRAVLRDIQDGSFAKRMGQDAAAGSPRLVKATRTTADHPMEKSGRELRAMLPWLK
ncbi:MAG: ketol-acid reductoisomerase [Phycisphaerales bacterium]|nr:ketol-acid reductoisomerase [Phycisphaerales bacterium]